MVATPQTLPEQIAAIDDAADRIAEELHRVGWTHAETRIDRARLPLHLSHLADAIETQFVVAVAAMQTVNALCRTLAAETGAVLGERRPAIERDLLRAKREAAGQAVGL